MQILNPQLKLAAFFSSLITASSRILFLDYDGTLAPFTENRNHALPYPGITKLLEKVASHHRNRIILVSGRTVDNIRQLLDLGQALEIWGCHGSEHLMPDGSYQNLACKTEIKELFEKAEKIIKPFINPKQLEKKPAGLAIHWRGLEKETANFYKSKIGEHWHSLTQSGMVKIQSFNGGMELVPTKYNKGNVVKTILDSYPYSPPAAFLGDDLTDEHAFEAIHEKGLAVLVSPEFRATQADLWIQPPHELFEFLSYWI